MSASDEIWILGIRMTKFGKHPDLDTVDLAAEAAMAIIPVPVASNPATRATATAVTILWSVMCGPRLGSASEDFRHAHWCSRHAEVAGTRAPTPPLTPHQSGTCAVPG